MITLTEEQAQQIEETLVLICKAHPEVNGGFLVNMALDNIRAARAQEQAEREACAKVCEPVEGSAYEVGVYKTMQTLAAAIRSRGEK